MGGNVDKIGFGLVKMLQLYVGFSKRVGSFPDHILELLGKAGDFIVEPGIFQGDGRLSGEGGGQAPLIFAVSLGFSPRQRQHTDNTVKANERDAQPGADPAQARNMLPVLYPADI